MKARGIKYAISADVKTQKDGMNSTKTSTEESSEKEIENIGKKN